ncbi:hypothetical protein O181_105611 [Austropuccinia psidii MF-1]|uniref:Uncharacterized protein n=1 Tax=Austropuccinia psidii MF-1 TaxID=1389203 RepID=A0A9Q3PMG1_9BASI|nr:hypothetical protein [Austropuccinia psidii MF-1]
MRLQHCPPSPSSPLLTLSHPRPYHLYAHVVPSRHASDTTSHPYACVLPSRHFLPSLHLRSALLTYSQHQLLLCLCSALPTHSRHCLPSLCLRSALPTCLQCCLPSLDSPSALPTCLRRCLPSLRLQCPPDLPLTLLTILKLIASRHASDTTHLVPSRHASNTTYHPYAHLVPSQHAFNAAFHPYSCSALLKCLQCFLPSLGLQCATDMPPTLLTIFTLTAPSRHASNTSYRPYAHVVPSRHASDAAYHPYACSALPTCLQHHLTSLRLQCPPDMPPTLLTILMLTVPS